MDIIRVARYLLLVLGAAISVDTSISAEETAATPAAEASPAASPAPELAKIYKHYRFGDGEDFIPGPTPTPVVDLDKEGKKLIEEAIDAAKRDMPDLKEVLKGAFEAPEMQKCKEDKTDDVAMPEAFPEGLEGENSPTYDLLFLDENEIPEDYAMIFGVTTLVVPFVRQAPNIGWELVSELGVPCIPYRIRFQKSKIFVDSGLNALKNYAKSPTGEFHPYIKAKYNIK